MVLVRVLYIVTSFLASLCAPNLENILPPSALCSPAMHNQVMHGWVKVGWGCQRIARSFLSSLVYFVEYKNTVPDKALFDDGSEVSIVGWRCRKRGKPLGASNFNGVIPTLFRVDNIVVRNERTIADDYKVYALSNEH